MTEAPSYRNYGDNNLDPVLETSVVDLTRPEVVRPSGTSDQILPSKGIASPEEIARNHARAHKVLDEVEAMLNRKPTQEGGENNE